MRPAVESRGTAAGQKSRNEIRGTLWAALLVGKFCRESRCRRSLPLSACLPWRRPTSLSTRQRPHTRPPPPPIPPVEPPARWDAEADVVIIGSGGGGLVSAIRLANAGLSTIVLEKQGLTGGTTRCGGFFVNLGGHKQANAVEWALPSYPYDPDKIAQWINSTYFQLTGDPALLRAMAVKGPECIDWMIDDLGKP